MLQNGPRQYIVSAQKGTVMPTQKSFKVFGEPVHVLITSDETGRSFAAITQTSPPGGGPPPHVHQHEDEIFTVVEGEFELFDGQSWRKLAKGETAYTLRGQAHTFRNCGAAPGTIQCVIVPGSGFENYLEAISVLAMPGDAPRLMEISARYGIEFLTPEPPTAPPV
jgi:quercetin dioxygenase-like cupin family protein